MKSEANEGALLAEVAELGTNPRAISAKAAKKKFSFIEDEMNFLPKRSQSHAENWRG